tara:strand:- start:248 stop:439 length:192 start_codon:yes stop_codon:yes gene_type:complete
VVFRSLKIALIVGIVLALINHGEKIVFGKMSPFDWLKVIVTFLVPYTVATISAVLTLKHTTSL